MKYRYLWDWLLDFYAEQYWGVKGKLGVMVRVRAPLAVVNAVCSLLDCTKFGGRWEEGK